MTANIADVLNIPYDHTQEMTDYLAEIDPRNYRDYSRWFGLMVKCKYAGETVKSGSTGAVAIQTTLAMRRGSAGIGTV
jgi:hypothetical protein